MAEFKSVVESIAQLQGRINDVAHNLDGRTAQVHAGGGGAFECLLLERIPLQGPAKEWSLGWVIPARISRNLGIIL